MKKFIYIVAVLLLMFNSIGAMYGGWSLIADPTGEQLKMSPSVLNHTPFSDFLIPGIVLLLVNGVFSLIVVGAMFFATRSYPLLVTGEGCLLTGWILIQYFWTETYYPLQVIMGAIGLLLVICGCFLFKDEHTHFRVV